MAWITLYVVVAVVVALSVFLGAEFLRRPETPAPQRPEAWAAVAGAIWPVLLVGVAQWALIAAIGRHLSRAGALPAVGSRLAQPVAR